MQDPLHNIIIIDCCNRGRVVLRTGGKVTWYKFAVESTPALCMYIYMYMYM